MTSMPKAQKIGNAVFSVIWLAIGILYLAALPHDTKYIVLGAIWVFLGAFFGGFTLVTLLVDDD